MPRGRAAHAVTVWTANAYQSSENQFGPHLLLEGSSDLLRQKSCGPISNLLSGPQATSGPRLAEIHELAFGDDLFEVGMVVEHTDVLQGVAVYNDDIGQHSLPHV